MQAEHTILVIDDDLELRKIYRHTLERANYAVQEASNGVEALEMLKSLKPDVIILDMMMPDLNGEAFLQTIQNNPEFPQTHTVVITAYPQYRETAIQFGADHFLTKPVHTEEIVKAVQASLLNAAS